MVFRKRRRRRVQVRTVYVSQNVTTRFVTRRGLVLAMLISTASSIAVTGVLLIILLT